jgi:hypothetical protein
MRRRDFHEAVVERCCATKVRRRLTRHCIRILATRRQLAPPDRRRDDNAATRPLGDTCGSGERSAIVEDSHDVTGCDAALKGIIGMDFQPRRRLFGDERRKIGERRIQIGRVRAIEIAPHFRAQLAIRRRMPRSAADPARRSDRNSIEWHPEIVPTRQPKPCMAGR